MLNIIVAVLGALLAVYLAFWRFRKEHLWSRKVDEYIAILEALHVAKDDASEYIAEIEEHRDRSDEQKEESYGKSREAQKRIQKALDMGGFLLCPKASTVLIDVLKGIDSAKNQPTPYEQASDIFVTIRSCLNRISAIAKEDLRLTGCWRSYWKRRTPHE